ATGQPSVSLTFTTKAKTAVTRSENGIIMAVLFDDTVTDTTSYSYSYLSQVSTDDWTTTNYKYLKLIFEGAPNKVLVYRAATGDALSDVLAKLTTRTFDWLTVPGISDEEVTTAYDWIVAQRATQKTYNAVLACSLNSVTANSEGVVDFASDNIVTSDGNTYTASEYCARIAGILAATALNRSATYTILTDVESFDESSDPDTDADDGKLILLNDGEKIKLGRAVNSLHILEDDQTDDMKKIKIIEAMDLIRDDITTTFTDSYVGVNNSHANKLNFIAAVNAYFAQLESEGVLYDEYDNIAELDVEAIKEYLTENSVDVSSLSDDEIAAYKTGSYLYATADIQFSDAMEDLVFEIVMS
ncbi:MAG: phage tail sheath subtilisin-like domain-containing protein, partial [Lachnospiraceae bacterium]|nr:phage tail sheath subtilisin-like domain-containing protein [Lachnospiraceae bacterium]